ncbi:hypothetical protein [Pseudomonas putida]|uniref:hypothetical protein n=1 Tax=Pseudomonas putida TaxID=303 RepID=UPI003D99B7FD
MTIETKAESTQTSSIGLSSSWDGAKVFVNNQEVPLDKPFFLPRGVKNTLKLEVASLNEKEIRLHKTSDEVLVTADPEFGNWVKVANDIVTWKLNQATPKSEAITLVVSSREIIAPLVSRGLLMSPNLTHEVKGLLVDGRAFDSTVVLFRDKPYIFTVDYQTNTPVSDYPLTLTPRLLTGLKEGDVTVVPVAGKAHTWTVTASNRSGTLEFVLTGAGFTTPVTTNLAKAMSSNILDEVSFKLNGKPFPNEEPLEGDVEYSLNVEPKPLSPVIGSQLKFDWVTQLAGMTMTPASGTAQTLSAQGAVWKLKTGNESGEFSVKATFPQFSLVSGDMSMMVRAAKTHNVRFVFLGVDAPISPEITPGLINMNTKLIARVKTSEGIPVKGVRVQFICPDYDDGFGITNDNGTAVNSINTPYANEGIYDFMAKTVVNDHPFQVEMRMKLVRDD